MPGVIKLKSNTIQLGTGANTVFDASLVRLYNNTASNSTVTQYDSTTAIGSIDIPSGGIIFLEKEPAHTINTTSGNLSAVSVAYRY